MTGSSPARRLLIISYVFPPVGGAGVQRAVKFVKYLPEYGWRASVLTALNPSVPVQDESLLRDVPSDTTIVRAPTLEPSYGVKALVAGRGARTGGGRQVVANGLKAITRFAASRLLQPDPQILWYPAAARAGSRLLQSTRHDAVLVSGPPFSSFLVGAALSRRAHIPLILDYRDEWALSNAHLENRGFGRLAQQMQDMVQRRVVRAAAGLVATTASSARTLRETLDDAGSNARVLSIPNGFDPDDFAGPAPQVIPGERFRLVYTGTLWNLTSVAPLVEAVLSLDRRAPDVTSHLELVFVGRRTAEQQALLDPCRATRALLTQYDYAPHDTAIGFIRSAHLLCALLSDAAGAERVLPGKIFEYMAAERPILVIAPRGDLWQLTELYPAASRHEPRDVGSIARFLERAVEMFRAGSGPERVMWDSRPYDRRVQAGVLAGFLNEALLAEQRSDRC